MFCSSVLFFSSIANSIWTANKATYLEPFGRVYGDYLYLTFKGINEINGIVGNNCVSKDLLKKLRIIVVDLGRGIQNVGWIVLT